MGNWVVVLMFNVVRCKLELLYEGFYLLFYLENLNRKLLRTLCTGHWRMGVKTRMSLQYIEEWESNHVCLYRILKDGSPIMYVCTGHWRMGVQTRMSVLDIEEWESKHVSLYRTLKNGSLIMYVYTGHWRITFISRLSPTK